MNAMLNDEDLTRLFEEAAASFPVPDEAPGAVLSGLADAAPARPLLKRRTVRVTLAAAAVVAGVLAVQSFGDTPSLKDQQSELAGAGTSGAAAGPRAQATAASPGRFPGLGGTLTDQSGSARSPVAEPPAARPMGAAGGSQQAPAAPDTGDPDAAKIVKSGSMSLVVDDGQVSAIVSKVEQVAKAVGGYVSNQKSTEFGDDPSSTLTMRVPVSSYERVVAAVRKVGGKVASAESSGRDVTAQYVDTEAQIASLKAARSRFLTILSGARTIGETLSVQQRVDSVQAQIDRLEGQRRVLANQSSLATFTVTVSEKADIETTSSPGGLSKAWDDAKDGFTSGVEALIARSGRALLVLIVAVVAFFAARLGWRLGRRRLV